MWLNLYLCGWFVTTVAALVVANAFPEASAPRARGLLAILAGALWPVVVAGLAQFACVGYAAKRVSA